MLKDDLNKAKELVESEEFWSNCEESLGEGDLRDKYSGKVSAILENMSVDIDWNTDTLQRIKRAKLLEYYMLAVKALTMCAEVSWISKLLSKRIRLWDIKFGTENIEKNMIAHDLSAALSRKLEKLKCNSGNNTKAEIAWDRAMKARRRIDTAADIVALASLLGYSKIKENEFEEYLDECHGLVKNNGLEEGMISFFKQNDLTEYIELSLRTLSAIYWSRLNFRAYVYNYINFIEPVQDDNKVYAIMSRVIKEVSKGSVIDDAFNNISGIHALNEFNRLPS
jgi:hypothetical protein